MQGTSFQKIYRLAQFFILTISIAVSATTQPAFGYSFISANLQGAAPTNPTSIQFGPDGRLYVAQQNGLILAYTIQRVAAGDYQVTDTETIDQVFNMSNRNDDGSVVGVVGRQVTGILVVGTPANPVLYVTSSDPRIGAGGSGEDTNLDTNSGILSRLTFNGASWSKVDLVRGLPRSEENHSPNGMQIDAATNTLFLAQGGNTNAGAPSNNFAFLTEYALAAAILSIDLNAIDALPNQVDGTDGSIFKYDLPTLDDPDRVNTPGGDDPGDPFGGNDGLNQARLVAGGPVQIYAPGFRNAYDLVITRTPGIEGRMYTVDNGPNGGWGGHPASEGPGGTCTNNYVVGEPGFVNNLDGLHFIDQPGYYGGHPTPIRANPLGAGHYWFDNDAGQAFFDISPTADWPPVPPAMANPIECDYQQPGVEDAALMTFNTSTNGLVEYTATNFDSEITGSLLAAGFNGNIYRIEFNAAGTQVVNGTEVLASNFGPLPLDVTAQGDADIFPGTIWVGVYAANGITIFEPTDFDGGGGGPCTGAYDPGLDEDGDGFNNADEIDNGSDPCSAASQPPDNDNDQISDLNDPDDDNDGIPDVNDLFQVDGSNGLTESVPVHRSLFNNDPGTGFFGIGFTGLMANGLDYLNLFDPSVIVAGGAAGLFTNGSVTTGTAQGGQNDQENALHFGIDVTAATAPFVVKTRLLAPFFNGTTPQDAQSQGLYIGTGDQDNYIRIALNANGGSGGILVTSESGGVVNSNTQFAPAGLLAATNIDLYLTVDPAAGIVQPGYSIGSGPRIDLGGPLAVGGPVLTAIQGAPALAVGLIATAFPSAPVFTATWDFIDINFVPSTSQARIQITPNSGINASTFSTDSFQIENLSTQGENITRVVIDLSSAVLPDSVFDPFGTAGDTVAKDFTPDTDPGVGLIGHTFSGFHNGIDGDDGFDVLEITFDDFNPGELFTFSIDADPTSIKGSSAPGPGESGSVSGLEMSGATITVEFSDGTSHTVETYRTPASSSGSENFIRSPEPEQPQIELLGITQNPVTVNQAAQTVRVSASIGSDVALFVTETALFTQGLPGGGYDIDPFEANSFIVLNEFTAAIGPAGFVDIPVTLTQSNPDGGIHYLLAVVRDAQGMTGPLSQVLVVVYDPGATILGLEASPATVAFGQQALGGSIAQVVILTNTGASDLDVTALTFSGANAGEFSADLTPPFTVSPGSPVNLNITFSPVTEGVKAAALTLTHTGANPAVTVTLSGEGVTDGGGGGGAVYRINAGGPAVTTGGLSWSADQLFSGSSATFSNPVAIAGTTDDVLYQTERWGSPFSYTLPVTNGTFTVNLYLAEIWWGAPGGGSGGAGNRVFSVNVEGGQGTLTDYDIFAATGGAATAVVISFTDVAVADGSLNIDFTAGVDNAKVAAIEVLGAGGGTGTSTLTTDVTTLAFGSQAVGAGTAQTVTLGNSGDTPLDVTGFLISGIDAGDFSVDLSPPVTVNPGASVPLAVTFTPSSEGGKTATLTLAHTGDNPDIPIALSGTGTTSGTAVLQTSTGTLAFGQQSLGGSVTQAVVLSNTGDTALDVTAVSFSGTDAADFSADLVPPFTVSPGTPVTLTVTFAPLTEGVKAATLTLSHTGDNPAVTVTLAGEGVTGGGGGGVVYRINAGGPVVTTGGVSWSADQFAGGSSATFSNPVAIANTTDDVLFQTERWGSPFSYDLPVATGTFTVNLYFAEIWWGAPGGGTGGAGSRVLSVNVEGGQGTLTDYDIFSAAGGAATAVTVSFTGIAVSDGTLNIDFFASVDNAKIAAIEVLAEGGGGDTAVLTASTGALAFGTQTTGTSAGQTVTLGNSGNTPLDVTGFVITGTDAADFSVDLTAPVTVNPGAAVPLTVSFSPLVSGAKTAVLTLNHTGDNGSVTIDLSGAGIDPSTALLQVDTGSIAFGQQTVGGSAAQTVVLSNTGNTPLNVSDIQFSGVDAADFSADLAVPFTVSPGTPVTLTVIFAPLSEGAKAATMTLVHTGDNPSVAVSLSGEGIADGGGTTVRINAGGPAVTTGGLSWSADQFFTGSSLTFSNTIAIDGTTDDVLFQTERWGNPFGYGIPVVNGTYTVSLYLAEIWWGASGGGSGGVGSRIFNVTVEGGQGSLTDYDLFQSAGGAGTAVVVTFNDVAVTDGVLNIDFTATTDNAKIGAIEVLPVVP